MIVRVLTSVNCGCCKNYCSSLRRVGFKVTEIDASSEEGRAIFKKYLIKGLPTLFIEVDELHNDIITGNMSAEHLAKKYGL